MHQHDNAYKHLFSHPQAVRDLLQGFVHEDWVAQLDWTSLHKVAGSYVSDDLREREDDVVWRVQRVEQAGGAPNARRAEWVYVYLLLEFQSTVDRYMAVRLLTYVGLLYQDLIKSGHRGLLPAVFPLVLYNGQAPWSAATELGQLIEAVPASLSAYMPQLRYCLIDEGRIAEHVLAQQPHNSVAGLIRIERVGDADELSAAVAHLAALLQSPHNTQLRRAFAVWINRMVLKRFGTSADAPPGGLDPQPDPQDLPEVQKMIAERIEQWKQELIGQGVSQGLTQGLTQGLSQGIDQGEARALGRLLARRFGPVPQELQERITQAEPAQVAQWFDRAIDAASLSEVFGLH